jgi:hypothetical protein
MLLWGYRTRAGDADARAALVTAMTELGYELAVDDAVHHTSVGADGEGGALVLSPLLGGLEIASEVSIALDQSGAWVEVDLFDSHVHAEGREVRADGEPGPSADLDKAATEICEGWFEGGKYRTEVAAGLVAVLLELPDEPRQMEILGWKRAANLEWPSELPADELVSTVITLPPYRCFRHADGRTWQIRVFNRRVDLRIDADSPECVVRSRTHRDAAEAYAQAETVISEQLAEGFVEDGR